MFHDWNFNDNNPILTCGTMRFTLSLFTPANRYDPDPTLLESHEKGEETCFVCKGLRWAGGQEKSAGEFILHVKKTEDTYRFTATAGHPEGVTRFKITLYDQPSGEIFGRRRYTVSTDGTPTIFRYPNGWDDLFTPLIAIKHGGGVRFFRSLDDVVRPKSFCVKRTDGVAVELIFEEDARRDISHIEVPAWEVGDCASVEEIFRAQKEYVTRAYGLERWETRKDVPDWAKDIRLVVSLHGMHWSGYIFNTYAQMREKLAWFSGRIDPKSVLVYLPGFDGRYYYKYPDYAPDPRMGGEKGLHELMDLAHRLGFHVMPMYMINGANPDTAGFSRWGEPSRYHGHNGYSQGVASCDWDSSRSYGLGCGVGLNPGAPLWQNRLFDEMEKSVRTFGFDAIFLDLAAIYHNDPLFSTHEGTEQFIARLKAEFPQLLIGGEGWYDALGKEIPLVQCAGNGETGEMIWHDSPYAPFFSENCRYFGHLCLGDPAAHRNGVFEWGINPSPTRLPARSGLIPTVTVLEDTLDRAPEKVEEIIADALAYRNNQ